MFKTSTNSPSLLNRESPTATSSAAFHPSDVNILCLGVDLSSSFSVLILISLD